MDSYPFIVDFKRSLEQLDQSDLSSIYKKSARSELLYRFLARLYMNNRYHKDLKMILAASLLMASLTGGRDERSTYALYRRYQRLVNMELNELDERVRQYVQ